jgi:drug/metabolite transporter (DMT)-like permease
MTRRAWIAFAAMSVLWGVSYLLIKIAVRGGMPAPDVAWLRVAIAAAVLIPPRLARRDAAVAARLRPLVAGLRRGRDLDSVPAHCRR